MSRDSIPGTFEECADELNDLISTLEHYPHNLLALALRAHFVGLLQALLLHGLWTQQEVTTFFQEMEYETLYPDERRPA
jgi:hypothetical protein